MLLMNDHKHFGKLQLDIDFHHLKRFVQLNLNLFDFLSNFVAYRVEGAFSAYPTRVHRRALTRRNSHKYTESRWRVAVARPSRSQADGEPYNESDSDSSSDSPDRAFTNSCWAPGTVHWSAAVRVLPALEHVGQPAHVHFRSSNCTGWSCRGDGVRDRLTLARQRSTARRCRARRRRLWCEWQQWMRLELRPAAGQRAHGGRKTRTRRRRAGGPLALSNAESAQLESERLSFSAFTTATIADLRQAWRWRWTLDRALDSARREHAILRFAN